jgi:prepilin-type N-terminal cleavage/methylation domain-containing protein
MSHIRPQQKSGFTIIEVMIVLALAGIILLIVFLAVPALQRNGRNTEIRHDAASVLGAVNDFINNNTLQMPTTIGPAAADGTVTVTGAAGTNSTSTQVHPGTQVQGNTAMPTAVDTININLNHRCNGNAFDTVVTQHAVAAGFLVEGGTSNSPQCAEE